MDYSKTLKVNAEAEKVFDALTNEIPLWWTELFEGSANEEGGVFTVRFGESVHKTMQVTELRENSRIVWHVKDSLIAIPQLKNQTEWIGTSIVWEIASNENGTDLSLTHIGLNPEVECYDICTGGWQQFLDSLELFLETGKGNPFLR